MSVSARNQIPLLAPLQSQRWAIYNQGVALIDQLLQPAVLSRTIDTPPAAPASGASYIVGPGASADWAGHDKALATWSDGAWRFRAPAEGWLAFVVDTAELAVFLSGGWTSLLREGGTRLDRLGLNAAADAIDRLVVASPSSLLTHDGGDHRLKIDKAAETDTASLVFQTGASGRAELGLAGDDAFHLKVSPDGADWHEALVVAPASGAVGLAAGRLAFPAISNPSADPHTLDEYREGSWTPTLSFGGASAGVAYASPTAGRYTRIGRSVNVSASLAISSRGTSSGPAALGGLPFVAANDGQMVAASVGFATGISAAGAVLGLIAPNTSRIALYQSNGGSSAAISHTGFAGTAQIVVSATYDV